MIEDLPVDALTHVLDYLDIPSRIKLAEGNTTLQHRVYQECSQAWRIVDFSSVDQGIRNKLTGSNLRPLLERVNARENTVRLNLNGCRWIYGYELQPLRNSQVLEAFSFDNVNRDDGPYDFISILETMIPYKLERVSFGHDWNYYWEEDEEMVLDFFQRLELASMQRARENGTLCSACLLPLMEESRQIVGSLSLFCSNCEKHYCRQGSCPMNVRVCCECGTSFCEACNKCFQCFGCGKGVCSDCHEYKTCHMCGKGFCAECSEGICDCRSCGKSVCQECGTRQNDCPNDWCVTCQGCSTIATCAECSLLYCEACVNRNIQCHSCLKKVCGRENCRDRIRQCRCCNNLFCLECKEFEECGNCELYFCKSHNRMIDCQFCQMRHCYDCRSIKRCNFCARACFEECVCQDKKPPAKRQKLSSP